MFKEFKEFAIKGNVIDLAIGLVIGVAFSKIVTTFVNDIVTPPLGILLGKVDFANLFFTLDGRHYTSLAQAKAAGATIISYGLLMNAVIEFLIIAFMMFLVVRQLNRWHHEPLPDTKDCQFCLSKIPLHAVRCPQCTSELKDEYVDLNAK